jgi:adenylate cyclase
VRASCLADEAEGRILSQVSSSAMGISEVGKRIELRIGINLGDVIVEGDDLYGDGVRFLEE